MAFLIFNFKEKSGCLLELYATAIKDASSVPIWRETTKSQGKTEGTKIAQNKMGGPKSLNCDTYRTKSATKPFIYDLIERLLCFGKRKFSLKVIVIVI